MITPIFNESSHFFLDLTFEETDGTPYIPVTIKFRVDDVLSGTEMLADTVVTPPAANQQVMIPAASMGIIDVTSIEETRVATITSDDGLVTELNQIFTFRVKNLQAVS